MKTLAILLLILPNLAFAHDDPRSHEQPIQVSETVINKYMSIYQDTGVASAIAASQLHYDGNSHRYQLAIGAANYNGESALAAGFAYKLGTKGPLLSISAMQDSQNSGIGAGVTFGF